MARVDLEREPPFAGQAITWGHSVRPPHSHSQDHPDVWHSPLDSSRIAGKSASYQAKSATRTLPERVSEYERRGETRGC